MEKLKLGEWLECNVYLNRASNGEHWWSIEDIKTGEVCQRFDTKEEWIHWKNLSEFVSDYSSFGI